ncbi:LysR family transcriptional regulator [Acetobacterium paludosum]|uniref:LysR family transcriptional regulator n=1 Tax=Acetobacterium paludosum TaxID=52693 RepID=A0A923KX21_9FIRM|nr:LysR family transcriptional regulator [Acetobacterium paludosum]MBC3889055.1 LysR family transcriptional regulator [Acetobacterium paludosum]
MSDDRPKLVRDMIELKKLQYFVVCADVGSFSKAAEILYTTQPNVSKAIKALEDQLGFNLFERKSRGILLTAKGDHVYEYACKAIENVEVLSSFSQTEKVEQLKISSNPSQWMAQCFAEFYNKYHLENLQFHLYTASVEEIMKRVSTYLDEIGFVYVMSSQNTAFQYMLSRKHLEFIQLKNTQVVLYFGKKHPLYHSKSIESQDLEKIRLVQCYEDEFDLNNYWRITNSQGNEIRELKNVVVTNSDCILEQLLQTTDLANISSGYLTNVVVDTEFRGFPLNEGSNSVMFGYIKRKPEELSDWENKFIDFVIQNLEEKI